MSEQLKTLPLDKSRCAGRRFARASTPDEFCPDRDRCLRYVTIARESKTLPDYQTVAFHSMLRGPGSATCGEFIEVTECYGEVGPLSVSGPQT